MPMNVGLLVDLCIVYILTLQIIWVNIELRDQNKKSASASKIMAELYDLTGHKRAKVEIVNNIASINVQGLQKGIYILNINIDGQTEGHQVIVK